MQVRPMKQSSARSPHFYAGLSFVAAVVTIALKVGAYLPTGSVSLFSDEILSDDAEERGKGEA
jgi:divalent metal cation (Fe/Co/Zn/Cd) transporter